MFFTLRDHHPPSRRLLALIGLLALVAACDLLPEPPGQEDSLPPARPRQGPILPVITTQPPPPEPATGETTTSTTSVPGLTAEDLRVRAVAPLEGKALPQFLRNIDDGSTVLEGRITDPAGRPVPEATVRLERVTTIAEQRLETSTNEDGYWQVRSLSGGRYRVRAWREPDLAVAEPGAVFVENGSTASVDLALVQPSRFDMTLHLAPDLPRLGEKATFTVRVTSGSVDGNGRITNVPLPGVTVEFPSTDRWVNEGSKTGTTDDDGQARWTAECTSKGAESVTLRAERPESLDPRPAPGSPSTTAPPTTEPTAPTLVRFTIDLPACADALPSTSLKTGDTFKVPHPGAIPAGRYQVVDGPATCGFTYDAWYIVGWLPNRGTHTGRGELQLPWPARDLRRAAGSPAKCTYELVG